MSPGHWALPGPQWDRVTLLSNDTWPKSTPSPDQPPHPSAGFKQESGQSHRSLTMKTCSLKANSCQTGGQTGGLAHSSFPRRMAMRGEDTAFSRMIGIHPDHCLLV